MYVTSREEIETRSQLLLSSANYTPALCIFMSCLVCLIQMVNFVGEGEDLPLTPFYQLVKHIPISTSIANKYLLSQKGIHFFKQEMIKKSRGFDSWTIMKIWIRHFPFLLIFLSNKMKAPTFLSQAVGEVSLYNTCEVSLAPQKTGVI